MDSEYLKLAVGDPLAKSLAAVSQLKPADPIEFIALWLAKHVENQQREQQAKDDSQRLEEQRIAHQRKLDFERLKAEEDARIAREEAERIAAEARRKREEEFETYYSGRRTTESQILAQIEVSDQQKKNRDKVAPLHSQNTLFHYITSFASGLSNQHLLSSKTVSPADFAVLRMVLYLVGRRKSEFQKWTQAKKLLKETSIGHFNPLSKQPVKKFAYVAHYLTGMFVLCRFQDCLCSKAPVFAQFVICERSSHSNKPMSS
eukprot:TRINITY_DN4209_c0_g1_i3.p1 TRINITY_DN4209_c0_g1~~TRINITY_DN4209_c0_g1_i3.p1  ORF type:complete len:260 (-),score=47.83 TRINITY_DN4209_c0_g1_i3:183-962(-)